MKTQILSWLFVFTMMSVLAIAAEVEPPQWTFDEKDAEKELETWSGINQPAPLEIDEVKDSQGNKRSVLITKSQGGAPYFFPGGEWNSRNYEPFNGSEYDTLYMGVRVNSTNNWADLLHNRRRHELGRSSASKLHCRSYR